MINKLFFIIKMKFESQYFITATPKATIVAFPSICIRMRANILKPDFKSVIYLFFILMLIKNFSLF